MTARQAKILAALEATDAPRLTNEEIAASLRIPVRLVERACQMRELVRTPRPRVPASRHEISRAA